MSEAGPGAAAARWHASDPDPAEPGRQPDGGAARGRSGRALVGASAIVAAATFGSKILGFLRDTVLADRFGSSGLTDAYVAASYLTLVLFAAVGVAIQTVYIPLLASLEARKEGEAAERFAANVNGAVTLLVMLLVIALEIGAGAAVTPFAKASERPTAALLVRVMAPLILFYAWSGIAGGALNVRGVFGPNAAMGIPQNLIIIGSTIAGSIGTARDIVAVGWGSLVGTLSTFLVQVPALIVARFRFAWRLRLDDPLLRRMGRLAIPVVVTALAQQAALGVDRSLATRLPAGILTDLTWAIRLQALAYSILGMSIATVSYPSLAAAEGLGDMARFRREFARGLRLINFVTVPIMVGLFLLRQPAVRVFFQHGHFTAYDTLQTAYPLGLVTLGTLSFAWQDYLNRAFFALHDTRSPMVGGLLAVGANIVLDLWLVHPLRQGGLALGTAAAWTMAACFLTARLRARLGPLGWRRLAGGCARMLGAAALGFVPAYLVYPWLQAKIGHGGLGAAAALAVVCAWASVVYLAACAAMRDEAALSMLRAGMRRLSGSARGFTDPTG